MLQNGDEFELMKFLYLLGRYLRSYIVYAHNVFMYVFIDTSETIFLQKIDRNIELHVDKICILILTTNY